MNHTALRIHASPDASATPTTGPNRRNDSAATPIGFGETLRRVDLGARHQTLVTARDSAVSDTHAREDDAPSYPIDLACWTALFAAVAARIADTTLQMSSDDHFRDRSVAANGMLTALLECSGALAQLQNMFPTVQGQLAPSQ